MERMLKATAASEDTHAWFRNLRRVARQTITAAQRGRPIDRIADCGAGTGRNLDWLAELGRPIGIELTPLALAVGRARGRPLVRGTVTALPLPDACCDVVTSFDVLYCLDDESEHAALDEMYRVLRPGGLALVNAAAFDVLRGSHSALTHEVRRYTRATLGRKLEAAGFRVDRLTYTNALLFVPTLVARGLERATGRANQPSEADLAVPSAAVNAVLDWGLAAEAMLLRWVNLPFGTSVMGVARKPAPGQPVTRPSG